MVMNRLSNSPLLMNNSTAHSTWLQALVALTISEGRLSQDRLDQIQAAAQQDGLYSDEGIQLMEEVLARAFAGELKLV